MGIFRFSYILRFNTHCISIFGFRFMIHEENSPSFLGWTTLADINAVAIPSVILFRNAQIKDSFITTHNVSSRFWHSQTMPIPARSLEATW